MPQSLSNILVHIVFSTKERKTYLSDDIQNELHAYIGGIVANQKGVLLKAGSVADHIHLLIAHPRTCSPANLIKEIKTGSSKWLKTKSGKLRDFCWQNGYGIFSISPSHRLVLENYISQQKEHHQKFNFKDEFRRLMQKYGIAWDENYVWD